MTTKKREAAIKALRQAGRDAHAAGHPNTLNPHFRGGPDWMQWAEGYEEAELEAADSDRQTAAYAAAEESERVRLCLLTAFTEFTTAPTAMAQHRLLLLLKDWEDFIVIRTKMEIKE